MCTRSYPYYAHLFGSILFFKCPSYNERRRQITHDHRHATKKNNQNHTGYRDRYVVKGTYRVKSKNTHTPFFRSMHTEREALLYLLQNTSTGLKALGHFTDRSRWKTLFALLRALRGVESFSDSKSECVCVTSVWKARK